MNTVRPTRAMLAVALLGTFVAQSAWACKVPMYPKSIPDGRSANAEVMLKAKQQVEQYLQHVDHYMSCEGNALKLQEVVATQNMVIDRFNAELRVFNQARSTKVINRQ